MVEVVGVRSFPVDAVELAEHVVVRVLAGQLRVLEAVRGVAEGASPVDVALRYGVSKPMVRGWVERVRSKVFGRFWERKFLRVYSAVRRVGVEPIIIWFNGHGECLMCGYHCSSWASATHHVITMHRVLVDYYVTKVLKEVFGP